MMKRLEAVCTVRAALPASSLVIACNGMVSRELYALDRDSHFYMIGSMGLATSIGLGLALAQPTKTVVVLDGDGNLLMNLGTLGSIAAARVKNLHHVVFDNHRHASTGGQQTISKAVPLHAVAAATGYRSAVRVGSAPALEAALHDALAGDGPTMIVVELDPGHEPHPGRVAVEPPQLSERFRARCLE